MYSDEIRNFTFQRNQFNMPNIYFLPRKLNNKLCVSHTNINLRLFVRPSVRPSFHHSFICSFDRPCIRSSVRANGPRIKDKSHSVR